MDTKTPTTSYHHQRAPRTPESYFNVPESIALLNIVKSERIQSAFQSNRKNHASVWEMVAEVLNRFSSRKRSAKQCCNRYENLKKIYTQLKKNPERHVRRNWPYMFLFKEIEENRGECWGSNSKRLTLIAKNHKNLSYFHRRRQMDDYNLLLNKDAQAAAQHSLLQSLMQANTDSNNQSTNSKLNSFLANGLAETNINENEMPDNINCNIPNLNVFNPSALQLQIVAAAAAVSHSNEPLENKEHDTQNLNIGRKTLMSTLPAAKELNDQMINNNNNNNNNAAPIADVSENNLKNSSESVPTDETETKMKNYEKASQGSLRVCENNMSMKSEPMSEGEFNPDDIQLMQTNYNGTQGFYSNNMDHNILHPDVIVDTDNISDCSSTNSLIIKSKRKLSTSTDGEESTNYELIEYLKRREKRDEELLNRMDAREERLLNLLERTVVAIEAIAHVNSNSH